MGSIEGFTSISFKDISSIKCTGRYALCRTVSLPTCLSAIEVSAEDPSGDIRLLSMDTFPLLLLSTADELQNIFPIGTLLAIREPHRGFSLNNPGSSSIQVDSPTDLVFLNDNSITQGISWATSPTSPNDAASSLTCAIDCKKQGNSKFSAQQWLSAAIAYTKGLAFAPTGDLAVILRSNRAEAYLKLGYLSAALWDAKVVLTDKTLPQDSDIFAKSLLRAGKASYFQDNFEEALDYFIRLKESRSKLANLKSTAQTWITSARLRIAEQKHGDYNWLQMFEAAQVATSTLDVADYVGPITVACLSSRGGGRGMIASKDILPGQLLLVSKPFASVFTDEVATLALNSITNRVDITHEDVLLRKCVQKVYANPSLKKCINNLYAAHPHAPPPSSYTSQKGPEIPHGPLHPGVEIDVSKMKSICSINSFSPFPLNYAQFVVDESNMSSDMPEALYLLPSIFNHSCLPNASHFFYRDIIVVRATSTLSKGDEIFLTYTGPTLYERRTAHLNRWGFSCSCHLCEDDRNADVTAHLQRAKLNNQLKDNHLHGSALGENATMRVSDKEIQKIEQMIKQMESTYTNTRHNFKIGLVPMHHRLAFKVQKLALTDPQHYHRAISEEIKALKLSGIPVIDDSTLGSMGTADRRKLPIDKERFKGVTHPHIVVMVALSIVLSFFALDDEIRGERWLRAAWLIDDIIIGGGRKLFDKRHDKPLSETGPYRSKIASMK